MIAKFKFAGWAVVVLIACLVLGWAIARVIDWLTLENPSTWRSGL